MADVIAPKVLCVQAATTMARSKVVQVPCDADLYAKIVAYRDEKGLEKDAAAARDLILFALRILEHKDDVEGLTTRELLEVILTYTVKAQHTSSLVYYQTYNAAPVDIQSAGIKHKETMRKAEEKVEQILAGENKED